MTGVGVRRPEAMIVAEVGVNHNGDVGLGRELIAAVADAGVDAVKFQSFTPERLAAPETPLVGYQERGRVGSSHLEMLRALALDGYEQAALFDAARSAGLGVISTPYDLDSLAFLVDTGIDVIKTASADIVDLPLQEAVAATGLPVQVATGMATLGEIEQVVDLHADASELTLLHCVSAYPAPDDSLHLRAIPTLASAFDVAVGYSDHSIGDTAAIAARALGAIVFEKHVTLDRGMDGPDHAASIEPDELVRYVRSIRTVERQLGSPRKRRQAEESEMAAVSRKSLVLRSAVDAGAVLTREALTTQRPGLGISPQRIGDVVGRRARNRLSPGHVLDWGDLA